MGKSSRNTSGHRVLKRHHRDLMRPRNLARSANRLPARLDGSTLTTYKDGLGDLRRQNALKRYLGNGWRNIAATPPVLIRAPTPKPCPLSINATQPAVGPRAGRHALGRALGGRSGSRVCARSGSMARIPRSRRGSGLRCRGAAHARSARSRSAGRSSAAAPCLRAPRPSSTWRRRWTP